MPRILRATTSQNLLAISPPSFARWLFFLTALAGSPYWVAAEPANGPIVHIIRSGDTFSGLAKRYLKHAARWPAIAHNNPHLIPRKLRPGDSVRIFGAHQQMLDVVVLHAGGVVRQHHQGKPVASLAGGEKLKEGDRVEVLQRSHVALQLGDGSVLRLGENTSLTLQQMRGKNGRPEESSSVGLYLQQGRVEAEVMPRPDGSRYEVRTPLATAGVRGTEFGVSVSPSRESLAVDVVQGSVVVKSSLVKESALLTPQQGAYLRRNQSSLRLGTLLPAPDLSAIPKSIGLDFTAVALPPLVGASTYELMLAEDAAFSRILDNRMLTGAAHLPLTLNVGDYYLSVRGIDSNGGYGTPSRIRITIGPLPEPPFQISPSYGTQVPTASAVTLICAENLDATAYKFQLSQSADFRQVLQEEQVSGHCMLQVNQPLAAGRYYWRVAAVSRHADGRESIGDFGAISTFEGVPAVVAPTIPSAAATTFLRWPETAGARYRLQISDSETFGSIRLDLRSQGAEAAVTGLAAGEYFARFKVIDSRGIESGFSAPQRFRVGDPAQVNGDRPTS